MRSSGEPERAIDLRDGVNTIGRAEENDIVIEHASISAHHCVVSVSDSAVVVRDLRSSNGTFIDGRRITQDRLQPGHVLCVGEVELIWEKPESRVAIPSLDAPSPAAPTALPEDVLACLHHTDRQAVRQCSRCHHVFCESCVHHLRRVGGRLLHLCPLCSGICQWIGPERPARKGLLEKVKSAFRSAFKT